MRQPTLQLQYTSNKYLCKISQEYGKILKVLKAIGRYEDLKEPAINVAGFNMDLMGERMDALLRLEYVLVECQNANCTDSFRIRTLRRKVKISFRDLIEKRISSSLRLLKLARLFAYL